MSFAAKLMPEEAAGGGRIAPNADGGGEAELSVSEGGGAIAAPATKNFFINERVVPNEDLKSNSKF
jgi:hypothetical protein